MSSNNTLKGTYLDKQRLKSLSYKQVFPKLFGGQLKCNVLTFEQLSFKNVCSVFDD